MPRNHRAYILRLLAEDVLAAFDVCDLQISTIITATKYKTTIERERDASDWPNHICQCTCADPGLGIPKRNNGIRTTAGEIATSRAECKGECRTGVAVQGVGIGVSWAWTVTWCKFRKVEYFNTTFPCCKKDFLATPTECDLVCLNISLMSSNWLRLRGVYNEDSVRLKCQQIAYSGG